MKFAALRLFVCHLSVVLSLTLAAPVAAQDQDPLQPALTPAPAWVQIEAQPDPVSAQERAAAWAAVFPDVQAYDLGGGWYGIVLGPYDDLSADARLRDLRRENLIPRDSFVADGSDFGPMFFPASGPAPSELDPTALAPDAPIDVQPLDEATGAPAVAVLDPVLPTPVLDETPDEARASESLLTQTEREDLQTALNWFGFYDSRIDGAFGRGTRASMAAWQSAQGLEPTGILTTRQRDTLTAAWRDETSAFGFTTILEAEAGIEVTIPGAMVEFDHYEPPFVHFRAKDGSKTRLILISTPGTSATLSGLYDTLQTLEIMPPNGPRALSEDSFSLRGDSADLITVAEASASRGAVKGWMLSFDPADAPRMERALATIKASFRSVGDRALDPGMVPLDDTARQGLLAGLEVRHAKLSRSGFYVDATGAVVTVAEAVSQCGRILLDGVTEATVAATDATSGLAVLKPVTALAPAVFASFAATAPAVGAELSVAGYSYEDRLSAPVLTFGRLAELGGLQGEPGINRLAMTVLAGDAGGPVMAQDGAVIGALLPRVTDGGRVLPGDVAFATTPAVLAAVLASAGVAPNPATAGETLSPDALNARAAAMTVLVSCYE